MIEDIISSYEFEIAGIQCLCQSINTLFYVYDTSLKFLEDEILPEDVTVDEVWNHNFVAVNTSFILVHQGLEAFLKWKISKESSLLLLDQPRSDWPTLPLSKTVKFSELHHIGGVNLTNTFFAVNKSPTLATSHFYKLIEDIRKVRNEIIHVRPKDSLKAVDCLKYALGVLSAFYGKDKWIELLRDQYLKNPLLGYSDYEAEAALFFRTLKFIINTVGKSEINNYLSVNVKARSYCCPKCTYDLYNVGIEPEDSKLSYLIPNKPGSTNLKCLICGKDYEVKRQDCRADDCLGNVISCYKGAEEYCLTCFNIN